MLEGSLTAQGFMLMLYGMGTVAVFLLLLVVMINLMSWVCSRYFPESIVTSGSEKSETVLTEQSELTAVISAAIHKFRSNRP